DDARACAGPVTWAPAWTMPWRVRPSWSIGRARASRSSSPAPTATRWRSCATSSWSGTGRRAGEKGLHGNEHADAALPLELPERSGGDPAPARDRAGAGRGRRADPGPLGRGRRVGPGAAPARPGRARLDAVPVPAVRGRVPVAPAPRRGALL